MDASRQSASFIETLSWSAWLFFKAPTNRWLLVVLAVMTGLSLLAGHASLLERETNIAKADDLAKFNRTLQLSEFGEETDLAKIVGRTLTKEELARARTQRLIATLPTSLAYSGGNFNALLPPSSWMMLGLGVSDRWPDRYRITAHSRRQNLEREDIVSPYQLDTGLWDVSTLVVTVMSLVIIALTFNLTSAEREQGLLPLLLVNVESYRSWILANALLRTILPVLTILVLTLPFAIYKGLPQGLVETFLRAAGFGSIVIAYGCFWMAVALLVNSFNGSSLTNGLVLMGIWLAVVCIVPASVSRIAQASQPVLSKEELITVERALRETAEKNGTTLLEKYYAEHSEVQRPTRAEDPYGQTRWDAIRLDVDTSFQPVLDRQMSQLQNRIRIAQLGIILSPALSAKVALDDLCCTSLQHYLDFHRRSCEFDASFKVFFQPRMMSRRELTRTDYEAMPTWEYRSISFEPHGSLLASSSLVTLAWICVIFAISWSRLRTMAF